VGNLQPRRFFLCYLYAVGSRHPGTTQHYGEISKLAQKLIFFSINLFSELNSCVDYNYKGEDKGKFHPRTGHEGPDGE
jgi:hypothetical protein